MSSRQRPGLPSDFELNVATVQEEDAPVQLDEYLDMEMPERSSGEPRPVKVLPKPEAKVVRMPQVSSKPPSPKASEAEQGGRGGALDQAVQSEPVSAREPAIARLKLRPARPPRKEISLDAEALRKVVQVTEDVRDQGPQADASASELVRALVHLAHDVRHKADYSHLNPRGQYGSPTARAFVADLKDTFLRAIGQLYVERYERDATQTLNVLAESTGTPASEPPA